MKPPQILLYTTPDSDIRVNTVLRNATAWLTREATVSKIETVQDEGYELLAHVGPVKQAVAQELTRRITEQNKP